MRSVQVAGNAAIRVAASLSLPRTATLERVEFYRSDLLVEAVRHFGQEAAAGAARTVQVEALIDGGQPDDFIRVVARLTDGREREDAQLLQQSDYRSEIDIQLAQFQILVTDGDGNPVSGLLPEDFEIRENGRSRSAVTLHTAHDVPLVLGLAVDSSDSMLPTWTRLKYIARSFLETAVTPGDRAFLVDFDHTVRLVQPLTEDEPLLSDRLDHLIPMGGTALNDGLLDDDAPWAERIEQAFDQIEEDLRHQQVLTYYSDRPPGTRIEPEIRVARRGLTLRSAVPLPGID